MTKVFPREAVEMIERVEMSRSSSFEDLIAAAGLDPSKDLRHASLRGVDLRGSDLTEFDLTGCDVEGALISPSTKLPPAEMMLGLKGSWINEPDRASIVELMRAIEASDPVLRKSLLSALIKDYDSDRHIDLFLLSSIKRFKSVEFAVDYFECMSPEYVLENSQQVQSEVKRLLLIEERRAKPRRKVGSRDQYSFVSRLIEWVADSDMAIAADAADEYRSGQLTLSRLIDVL